MGGTVFFTSIVAMAFALMVALPDAGHAGEIEQPAKYYKEYISNCICKYESKAALQTSRSVNLRRNGAIYEQKAVFLKNYQNVLVDEMIREEIGTKAYKIDYYLNKRFNRRIK
ncbi:MAG: hypothetical protein JRH12_25140 [Deltaproteobacteria bacterium]|jgi:hypothetical protein|nr:hypothetical protein [Deltaproteobacteria bacterium]MBW2482067.1 hypothetical protein [Deltaproteobacteria bacterium]